MPFPATVYNVLIASPSDVPEAREAIAKGLHEWNALHSKDTGKVLLPVMWESHSAPSMADRPQGVINDQVVRRCDMLVGSFWMRLGSSTGVEESGTIEEINWFLRGKKPVMLYFSDAAMDQKKFDAKQYARLQAYRAEIKGKGLQESYSSIHELSTMLNRHLTIIIREMSVGPMVDSRAVKRAQEGDGLISPSADTAQVAEVSSEIFFQEISDKAFVVSGDTRAFKDKLKEANGKWMPSKSGWMFSKRRLAEVAEIIGKEPVLRSIK